MTQAHSASAERNHWVRPVAIIVLAMMIVWNCTGWAVDKGATFESAFLVCFTAGLMALGMNASSQLRRAHASVETPAVVMARRFWFWVLVSTSLWSAGSAHHAYGQLVANDVVWGWSFEAAFAALNAAPLLIVLTVLAFFEPLAVWAIETVEQATRKGVEIGVCALEDKGGEAIAPVQQSAPAPSQRRATGHQARTLARELKNQTPSGASRRQAAAKTESVATEIRDVTLDEIAAACRAILERRDEQDLPVTPSLRLVSENLNVPKSRVEKALMLAQTKLAVITERVKIAA